MREDMSQLEDEIEFHHRNSNLPLFSHHHPMRELLLLHPFIIFLKLSVMPEAQQEARPIMYFDLHTLIRWELYVVIARLFMRRDRTDKGDNPLVTPFHPDINIARSPGIRIRIHQGISLPFQDAGSESLFPEPLRNLDGSIIQPNIRLLQHLAFRHPLEQYLLLHPYMFSWQLLDTIKENTHQALLLGNSIQLLLIRFLQGIRYLLGRTETESQEIKENLLLFQHKVVYFLRIKYDV